MFAESLALSHALPFRCFLATDGQNATGKTGGVILVYINS